MGIADPFLQKQKKIKENDGIRIDYHHEIVNKRLLIRLTLLSQNSVCSCSNSSKRSFLHPDVAVLVMVYRFIDSYNSSSLKYPNRLDAFTVKPYSDNEPVPIVREASFRSRSAVVSREKELEMEEEKRSKMDCLRGLEAGLGGDIPAWSNSASSLSKEQQFPILAKFDSIRQVVCLAKQQYELVKKVRKKVTTGSADQCYWIVVIVEMIST